MSCATNKLITLADYAAEQGLPVGRVLYVIHQPNAPRPVLRRGRDVYFDRDEILRCLRGYHWAVRC